MPTFAVVTQGWSTTDFVQSSSFSNFLTYWEVKPFEMVPSIIKMSFRHQTCISCLWYQPGIVRRMGITWNRVFRKFITIKGKPAVCVQGNGASTRVYVFTQRYIARTHISDSILIERIPWHILWVMGKDFWLVRPIQRGAAGKLICK